MDQWYNSAFKCLRERDVGNITSLREVPVFWWVSAMYDAAEQMVLKVLFTVEVTLLLFQGVCTTVRVHGSMYVCAGIEVVSPQGCPDCGHQNPHKSWASEGSFRFLGGEWPHFLRITVEENQFWDLPHLRLCLFSTEEWLILFLMIEIQSNTVLLKQGMVSHGGIGEAVTEVDVGSPCSNTPQGVATGLGDLPCIPWG